MLALVGRGGAAKDGMGKRLVFVPAPGAVPGFEEVGPRGVGGEVTLLGPHLMDTACRELAQVYEGVRTQGKRVCVVCCGGGLRLPFFPQEGHGPALKGVVGRFHCAGRREAGNVSEEVRVSVGGTRQSPQ